MELQHLSYFCHLAKTNHLTHSALELRISQPSLTQAIKRLESALDVRLFDRRGRNIHLNAYGEIFLEYAEPILDLIDQAQKRITETKNIEHNSVVIYAPPAIYTNLLTIAKRHLPNIIITNHQYSSMDDIRKKILKNEIDLCIQPPSFGVDGISSVELFSDKRILLVSRENYDREDKNVRLFDFKGANFVAYDSSRAAGLEFKQVCRKAGFEPKITYVNSLYEIIESVKTGLFIALVPERILERYQTEGLLKLYITDLDASVRLNLYWNAGARKRAVVTALRQLIIDNFKNRLEFYN